MAIFDVLSLPGELRNSIYRFTLTTDPSELDREHKYDCPWCTWDPNRTQHAMYWDEGQRLPGCRCWARSGLALLLANRQINKEAASIFWSENHFTFRGPESLTLLLGWRLRPWYRQTIRDITVLPGDSRPTRASNDRFWTMLFSCKGLRNLEIPNAMEIPRDLSLFRPPWTPKHHHAETDAWDHLTSQLPNLKTFAMTIYTKHFEVMLYPGFPLSMKITKCWAIEGLSPEQLQATCRWTMNDVAFACGLNSCVFPRRPRQCLSGDRILLDHVLFRDDNLPPAVRTGKPHEYRCVLNRGPSMVTWTAQQFFQPLSPDVIARNSVLRSLKKTESDEDSTWSRLLRRLSLVLGEDLSGLGQQN